MLGCAVPGSAVRCSTSDNPKRKLAQTLEMIRVKRTWVGLHTGLANHFAERVIAAGVVPELAGYAEIAREVRAGEGSRLDFRLAGGRRKPAWVEVKSVTLAEDGVARFPDSVSERATRHSQTLARLRAEGSRAVQLYVVQRGDCERVRPADEIDPRYGEALRAAVASGVEVVAVRARVSPRAITFDGILPVEL